MASDDLPRYRILNSPGFYAEDDCLYEAGREIIYTGIPNEHMEPLNDAAKSKLDSYLDGLEQAHRVKMVALGRDPGSPRPRDIGDVVEQSMKDRPREARVYPSSGEEIPTMGHLVKKGRGRPRNVTIEGKPPEAPGKQKPVPILSHMNQSDSAL